MPGKSFTERLGKCMTAQKLTVSDIANWFDRPNCTCWNWVFRGRTPTDTPGSGKKRYDVALKRLTWLEWAIRTRYGFPVPKEHATKNNRPKYFRKLRRDIEHAKLPESDPS